MKSFLRRVTCGLTLKEDLPPPYEENIARDEPTEEHLSADSNYQILDLLAACSVSEQHVNESENTTNSEITIQSENSTSDTMGLKHSTPWSSRHRSKISLTWVLREQSDKTKHTPQERRLCYEDFRIKSSDVTKPEHCRVVQPSLADARWNRDSQQTYWNRDSGGVRTSARIVGRNALYNNMKVGKSETSSEVTSAEASDRARRRHRRRRKRTEGVFGYEIKNIDGFLAEASIERPGNIPVVLSCASTLYQTREGVQREMPLPLGTVVNAVFKKQAWLYVQTPHADEGYVQYSACLPLGILPTERANSPWHKTPCWESSVDIYPRPCGNMTDTQKENLQGRARSECGYRTNSNKSRLKQTKSVCGEELFDKMYLRATSVCPQDNLLSDTESDGGKNTKKDTAPHRKYRCRYDIENKSTRQTLLVISRDFDGCRSDDTLSVRQGEVVALLQSHETRAHADWFHVRKRSGAEGFIPSEIAGHGYI